MSPIDFPESNARFGPPEGLAESQVQSIKAFVGTTAAGSCDGSQIVVVAWLPTQKEVRAMLEGAPIYLTMMGGLVPHLLTTTFEQAINPA